MVVTRAHAARDNAAQLTSLIVEVPKNIFFQRLGETLCIVLSDDVLQFAKACAENRSMSASHTGHVCDALRKVER
jgi:hypothetical protein